MRPFISNQFSLLVEQLYGIIQPLANFCMMLTAPKDKLLFICPICCKVGPICLQVSALLRLGVRGFIFHLSVLRVFIF